MSGIVDVAEAAGVSPTTVSRALRGLPGVSSATRATVEKAAARLGYFPSPTAAALPTGRTKAVGVLVPWVSRWFFSAVIDGARDVVAKGGYDLLLYAVGSKYPRPPEAWDVRSLSKRVDGILALSIRLSDVQRTSLQSSAAALVSVGPTIPGFGGVNVDDVEIGRAAAAHLMSLGHRTIAFIGGDPDDAYGLPVADDRLTGVRAVVEAAGGTIGPVIPAEFAVAGGEAAFSELLDHPAQPTAVVAACDEIAIGLMHRARAHGMSIPGDLSVVGVDGHDLAYLFNLTTVTQPVREQGRMAAEMLLSAMNSSRPLELESLTLPTTLEIRGTTAQV